MKENQEMTSVVRQCGVVRKVLAAGIAVLVQMWMFSAQAETITLTIDPGMPGLQTQVFQVEAGEWSEWIL